jgi:DNA topoisomerase-1
MVIKDGRFGPYVTDGETNASLRRGDNVETITPQRGAELLAERRAAAPAKPKRSTGKSSGTAKKPASTTKSSASAAKSSAGSAKKTTSTGKRTTSKKSG